jgi:urease accessory protein UreF
MSLSQKSARPALPGPKFARSDAANLRAEFSALLQQIGSPDFFGFFGAPSDALSENGFLQTYLTHLLMPVELPAIAEACGHAMRRELRELVAQDQRLTIQMGAAPFASSSRRTGRLQLSRLRPLRDERIVRRYLAAVESGRADGWHTVVYGLTLALYSLPLRQGLLHYAQETLGTLAKNFAQPDGARHLDTLMAQVPDAVEAALARC